MIFIAFLLAVSMYIWPPKIKKEKLKIEEEIEQIVEAQIELEESVGK